MRRARCSRVFPKASHAHLKKYAIKTNQWLARITPPRIFFWTIRFANEESKFLGGFQRIHRLMNELRHSAQCKKNSGDYFLWHEWPATCFENNHQNSH